MYLFDHYRSLCAYKLECYTLNKPCPKNLNIIIIAIIIIIVIKRRAIQWRMSFPAVWWPNVYEYYIYTRICILCASRPYSLMHEIPSSIFVFLTKTLASNLFPSPSSSAVSLRRLLPSRQEPKRWWVNRWTHTHTYTHTLNNFKCLLATKPIERRAEPTNTKKNPSSIMVDDAMLLYGLIRRFACLSKMRSVDGCQECVCVCVWTCKCVWVHRVSVYTRVTSERCH